MKGHRYAIAVQNPGGRFGADHPARAFRGGGAGQTATRRTQQRSRYRSKNSCRNCAGSKAGSPFPIRMRRSCNSRKGASIRPSTSGCCRGWARSPSWACSSRSSCFYLVRGPIRLERPPSRIKIKRFTPLERFTHWLTATSFIILAITGLNYVFGKRLLMPLIGPDAFATWSLWAKYLHNAFAWPLMLGLLLMAVLWLRDNMPDRYDIEWLKRFGGFLSGPHPPARRFNAGQKLIFWSVIIGGFALTASGIALLFPNLTDIGGIQFAQYVHAVSGVVMTAIMLAHIYIGTVGMEGALDAMVSGDVDLEWAKEHHRVWVEEEQARTPDGPQLRKHAVPAE